MKSIEDGIINLANAGYGLLELGGDLVRPETKGRMLLQRLFGDRLSAVLESDPNPMILEAVDILDNGGIRDAKQTWIYGWTGIELTTEDFNREFVPALTGAPVFGGHIYPGDHQLALATVVWAGISERTKTPSVLIYPKPHQKELREALRSAALLSTPTNSVLAREFAMSLSLWIIGSGEQGSRKFERIERKEQSSIDFVRWQGTKAARLDKALVLSEQGEKRAVITFDSIQEMLAHPDVVAAVKTRAGELCKTPEFLKSMAETIPLEYLSERADVKALQERPKDRDAVLSTLTVEELSAAVTRDAALRESAIKTATDLQTRVAEFRPKAVAKMTELGVPEEMAANLVAADGCEHLDLAVIELSARRYLRAIDEGSGGTRRGISEQVTKSDGKAPPAHAEKVVTPNMAGMAYLDSLRTGQPVR